MASTSEFQKILEQILSQKGSSAPEDPKEPPKFNREMNFEEINFKFGPLGINFSGYKTQSKKKEEPKREPPKAEPQIHSPPKVNVKPREKRKMTFDQAKAIETLGRFTQSRVNAYSTDDEIKCFYRELAKKFHPDFNKNGAEDFKTISLAYQKLIVKR